MITIRFEIIDDSIPQKFARSVQVSEEAAAEKFFEFELIEHITKDVRLSVFECWAEAVGERVSEAAVDKS